MKEQNKIEKWKNLTSFDLLTLNLTFKVKCHFGNRVILKAWPIVILSGMVASSEQKMPSKVFFEGLGLPTTCITTSWLSIIHFCRVSALLSAVIGIVVTVCPSVCLSHCGIILTETRGFQLSRLQSAVDFSFCRCKEVEEIWTVSK